MNCKGFTLVEALVAISIMGIALAGIVPSFIHNMDTNTSSEQHSDAVAVAGIRAAEGNGRRAVILLLGQEREDGSRISVETARRYLDALRVPLIVWDLSGPTRDVPPGWGDSRPVDNVDDLVRAVRRVRYQLDEQRIIWVNGRHLPQDIELSAKAKGIRLAE